jgi:hypothetical protein
MMRDFTIAIGTYPPVVPPNKTTVVNDWLIAIDTSLLCDRKLFNFVFGSGLS